MSQLVIDSRFCGPPTSGNGGYVGGVLATHVGGAAEVRLRKPPPIERRLDIDVASGAVTLRDGDTVVAEAKPAPPLDLTPPRAVTIDEAVDNSTRAVKYEVYSTCFVCGHDRKERDGLRIFPGPSPDRDLVAAPWTPDDSLPNDNGVVAAELVWAAIDCPGAFAFLTGPTELMLLGTMTAQVLSPVRVGETYVSVGWTTHPADGRKRFSGTALLSAEGDVCALGSQVWLTFERE